MNNNPTSEYQAEKLLKLALINKSERIYQILNNVKGSPTYKGSVFEHFLAGLYNGIGWKAVVHGGKGDKGVDILLYHQSRPSQVHTIIQAKNTKSRLSKKDIRHEYANFLVMIFLLRKVHLKNSNVKYLLSFHSMAIRKILCN